MINKLVSMVQNENIPDTLFVKELGDLVLLNYRPEVQFENTWTPIELISRGLIINRVTGEIVARPFDKFFNWGENGRQSNSPIKSIAEKLDGSLGILYRNPGYRIATRGSFESEQADWATGFLHQKYGDRLGHIPYSWTLLFEIIYPENRVVIDYHGKSALALLAIRNRFTGQYIPDCDVQVFADQMGFTVPQKAKFKDINAIIDECSLIGPDREGWVVEFEDGQRFKFKGDEYKKIHKLLSGLSFKFILEQYQAGTVNKAIEIIPDEFKDEVNLWIEQIESTISAIMNDVKSAFIEAPKSTRKAYALWCKDNVPELLPYMFAFMDGKDIRPIIYNKAFN